MGASILMTDDRKRTDERPEVYTVDEVAAKLRRHPNTIRLMIKRGEIPFFKVGREYRIHQNTLDGLMRIDKRDID